MSEMVPLERLLRSLLPLKFLDSLATPLKGTFKQKGIPEPRK